MRDMVEIYYIEKDDNGCSRLTPVPINPELGFENIPEGFFDQYNAEAESIFQIGYQNMQKKRREGQV